MTDSPAINMRQLSLPTLCPVTEAVASLANAGTEARGAVFTRREVVDFVLDLAGYLPAKQLHHLRLLEPSFGQGDFLLPAIERLVTAWHGSKNLDGDPVVSLSPCVRAVELHRASFESTRQKVLDLLNANGINARQAAKLADRWLIHGDFLLVPLETGFDFTVGNPPYVRQELIPDVLIAEYRSRYRTVFDRADLYIPFIERSLNLLGEGGHLGFICADRWMKNRYGGPLRQYVAANFHLKIYVDMVGTDAFHSEVIAYPAITVIARAEPGPTRIAHRPPIEAKKLSALARKLLAAKLPPPGAVSEVKAATKGAAPWIFESFDQLALIRRLEATLPTIEEAKCKVGIGVATGADGAFIGPLDELDVEADRKLPLVMTRDILTGIVNWRGLGVINPFAEGGGLVQLDDYPRLKRYLEKRKPEIAGRHVAQKMPANWYRTIDRIYPALAAKPKLLIPDIKGEAHVVYEEGHLYPHHNLYFMTSDTWNLQALQAVLLSGIARLFVSMYSTKMHGGFLRFQAQYLRRIRIPHWHDVSDNMRRDLIDAGTRRDLPACNRAVYALYGLTKEEHKALGGSSN